MCGKPMELKCEDEIPENFFQISTKAALFAHSRYEAEFATYISQNISLPVRRVEENQVYVGDLRLCIFPLSDDVVIEATKKKHPPIYPKELTSDQCSFLENFKWDEFQSTLEEPTEFIEVHVHVYKDKKIDSLLRMFIHEEKKKIQINCRGHVFLSHVEGSAGDCHWTKLCDFSPNHIQTPYGYLDATTGIWM
tara:strand:- start:2681 stop:3259 length:579 start_codon:yes stop_codon:yes gene_type:complete